MFSAPYSACHISCLHGTCVEYGSTDNWLLDCFTCRLILMKQEPSLHPVTVYHSSLWAATPTILGEIQFCTCSVQWNCRPKWCILPHWEISGRAYKKRKYAFKGYSRAPKHFPHKDNSFMETPQTSQLHPAPYSEILKWHLCWHLFQTASHLCTTLFA